MTDPPQCVTQWVETEPKIDQVENPDVQAENQTQPDPLSSDCVTEHHDCVTQSGGPDPKISQKAQPVAQTDPTKNKPETAAPKSVYQPHVPFPQRLSCVTRKETLESIVPDDTIIEDETQADPGRPPEHTQRAEVLVIQSEPQPEPNHVH